MIAKRQGLVSTFASVSLVGLALLVGVIWFLGTPGPVYACKCVVPGTPSEELEKFSTPSSQGESSRSNTPLTLMQATVVREA